MKTYQFIKYCKPPLRPIVDPDPYRYFEYGSGSTQLKLGKRLDFCSRKNADLKDLKWCFGSAIVFRGMDPAFCLNVEPDDFGP